MRIGINTEITECISRIVRTDSEEVKREQIEHLSKINPEEFEKVLVEIPTYIGAEESKRIFLTILSSSDFKPYLESIKDMLNNGS